MKTLPNTPQPIVMVVLIALQAYLKIFPRIWFLVAVSSIGHLVIPWLYQLNPAFAALGLFGFVLLTWFLYPVIMWLSAAELDGMHLSRVAAYERARTRYLSVLGSNLVLFAIALFMALVIYGLDMALDLMGQHPLIFVLSIILAIYVLVIFYFAIPVIVMEDNVIIPAFYRSIVLVKGNWWRTFIPLALILAGILGFEALGILFTGKDRMLLFTGYNFMVQMIFYPLIISMTLVMLNDLKLRSIK